MAPTLERMNPAACRKANGVRCACLSGDRQAHPNSNHRSRKLVLVVKVGPDDPPVIVTTTGREAQTLAFLIERGPTGFTSGEASPLGWARRTSAYVFKLRRLGIPISTVREPTPDGATVARYALAGPVAVLAEGEV